MKRLSRKKGRHFRRQSKPGAAPGTIAVDPRAPRPVVRVMAYGPGPLVEATVKSVDEIDKYLKDYRVTWINVEGLGDAELIRTLGQKFHLHPLALEDVVNVHQRPKVEEYPESLFIVARMVAVTSHVDSEQVSIFLGSNYVLSFIEDPGDCFETLRHRMRTNDAKLLQSTPGYLAYALLDAVTDAYFPVIEELGDRLEILEDDVFVATGAKTLSRIHSIKHDLRSLRRSIWPLREEMNALARESMTLIDDETRVYFRDCYDHTVQLMDLIETYRELCSDMTDMYLSTQSNRMNEVMKVLTVIATVFIPITFFAGVYGMNFEFMPELHWRYGYAYAWAVMIAIAVAMLYFFAQKGWLRPFVLVDPKDLKNTRDEPWADRPLVGSDLKSRHDEPFEDSQKP